MTLRGSLFAFYILTHAVVCTTCIALMIPLSFVLFLVSTSILCLRKKLIQFEWHGNPSIGLVVYWHTFFHTCLYLYNEDYEIGFVVCTSLSVVGLFSGVLSTYADFEPVNILIGFAWVYTKIRVLENKDHVMSKFQFWGTRDRDLVRNWHSSWNVVVSLFGVFCLVFIPCRYSGLFRTIATHVAISSIHYFYPTDLWCLYAELGAGILMCVMSVDKPVKIFAVLLSFFQTIPSFHPTVLALLRRIFVRRQVSLFWYKKTGKKDTPVLSTGTVFRIEVEDNHLRVVVDWVGVENMKTYATTHGPAIDVEPVHDNTGTATSYRTSYTVMELFMSMVAKKRS
jgi:hypothetical protein